MSLFQHLSDSRDAIPRHGDNHHSTSKIPLKNKSTYITFTTKKTLNKLTGYSHHDNKNIVIFHHFFIQLPVTEELLMIW